VFSITSRATISQGISPQAKFFTNKGPRGRKGNKHCPKLYTKLYNYITL